MSEQSIETTPRHSVCDECRAPILIVLAEPEGKLMRLDSQPKRLWRLVEVTPSHSAAVSAEVYESHTATCKEINR